MGIFSGNQSMPYVPPIPAAPPPAPSVVDKEVVDAAGRKKAELAASGGYSSTNPTGGQGVTGTANVRAKTLLGQ